MMEVTKYKVVATDFSHFCENFLPVKSSGISSLCDFPVKKTEVIAQLERNLETSVCWFWHWWLQISQLFWRTRVRRQQNVFAKSQFCSSRSNKNRMEVAKIAKGFIKGPSQCKNLIRHLLLLQALVVAHPGLIWVFADANQQSFQLSRVVDEGLSAKVPACYCPPYRVSSGAGCHDVVDCLLIPAMFAIWCPLMTKPCQGGSVHRRVPAHALVPDNLVSSVDSAPDRCSPAGGDGDTSLWISRRGNSKSLLAFCWFVFLPMRWKPGPGSSWKNSTR